ncbi:hypothetical protein FOA52_006489 [Chlamydomonas sp. UWO 241]|nr:hypothetical protein FOA52_006489 [Chlamydomonas sp. UWO 241]
MASEEDPNTNGSIAADVDPAPKRVKLSSADPIEGVVNPALLSPASVEALQAAYASAEPYLHCVFTEPFDASLLANVRDEIINNINATYKETDLFKLFQTGDLGNLAAMDAETAAKIPSLVRLKDALYSDQFRAFIRTVTGCGELAGQTDCSCNVYANGCHLLCHDDVIGTRRVSWIIYLTDPDDPWVEGDGGALELYPLEEGVGHTPAVHPSVSLLPTFNSMAMFTVQPGKSFHSVQTTLLALPGAPGASTDAEASSQHLHGTASNHISAAADTTDALSALSAVVDDLRRQVGSLEKELVSARAQPQIAPRIVGVPQIADDVAALRTMVESQKQQIEALTGMLQTSVTSVSHLVSRVPGAPMQTQMPHARAPAKAAQPARLATAAAASVAPATGAPAGARPAAAGAARAARASSRAMRGLPAVAAAAQRRHSFVATFSMEDATAFAACHDHEDRHVIEYLSCIDDEETVEVAAVAARQVAAAAATGVSLPVCLAESIVSHVQRGWRVGPAGGSVVSASFLNAKPASGGIGVVPRRGDVLRVLFTVTSDAVAGTVLRYRCSLRCCANISTKTNIFDVLTDTEEAQRQALWTAFVAAKAAGKRAQFHHARLMIDGERLAHIALKEGTSLALAALSGACELTDDDLALLIKYVNPSYLNEDAWPKIQAKFEEDGSVQLQSFLKRTLADTILSSSLSADTADGLGSGRQPLYTAGVHDGWSAIGPPHKQRYLRYDGPPASTSESESPGELLAQVRDQLFASGAFARLLRKFTTLGMVAQRSEVRRFRPGLDYTVAHYGILTKDPRLDVVLAFVDNRLSDEEAAKEKALLAAEAAAEAETADKAAAAEGEEAGASTSGAARKGKGKKGASGSGASGASGSGNRPLLDGAKVAAWETGEVGGFEAYLLAEEDEDGAGPEDTYRTAADDESGVLNVSAEPNSLNLVLRDEGLMKFLKYVSYAAPSSRWDVAMECVPEPDSNDEA